MRKIKLIAIILSILLLSSALLFVFYKFKILAQSPLKQEMQSDKGVIEVISVEDSILSNGEYAKSYYDYNFSCNWSGTDLKCNGEINYLGQDYKIEGVYLYLWCLDKEDCFLGTDKINLISLEQKYNFSCSLSKKQDVKAILAIADTPIIYPNPARCTK